MRGICLLDVKQHIRSSCTIVILLFCLAVFMLVLKGMLDGGERFQAFFNGIMLVVLLAHVLVLIDITRAVFVAGDETPDTTRSVDVKNAD